MIFQVCGWSEYATYQKSEESSGERTWAEMSHIHPFMWWDGVNGSGKVTAGAKDGSGKMRVSGRKYLAAKETDSNMACCFATSGN